MVFAPLPREGTVVLFRKVGTRAAQAISKVVFAGVRRAGPDGRLADVRLALGSVAAVPVRAGNAERAATGRPSGPDAGEAAAAALDGDISPIDDVRSTAAYRRSVARNLVREFVAGGLGRAL